VKALVFLPTYNEKDNIERMVETILGFEIAGISKLNILIVDDSSPDGTGELADNLMAKYPDRLDGIHRKERGRGTAGIAAFQYALEQDVDYVIEMDADFSHNPQDIPRLIKEGQNYDIIIGSRFLLGSRIGPRSPWRRLTSWGAGLYTRMMLGIDIKDWSSGYKCYRKQALARLNYATLFSKGYSIGMETLYKLIKGGCSYKEIPITFIDRAAGVSKFTTKESLNYIKIAWRLRFKREAL
jgi:dolichol-phosphate mannosyltransferase